MAKVIKNQENLSKCICPKCPSYNSCATQKNELLFCAEPLSARRCTFKRNGCICGDCPIHSENKLKKGYYCILGSADEIDDKA
jgi:aldose sugar dehydrogenase